MRITHPLRTLYRVLLRRTPIEAQLIVTRRCNLSCGYCTEYDDVSAAVPLAELRQRIDALHRLGVVNISLLGGEPLLHPEIDQIVAYANRSAQVSITTNGFLLSETLIARLNAAGLSNMQISIDTLRPDPTGYIQKSLKALAPKLARLKRLARFDVHVNVVLCANTKDQFLETLQQLRTLKQRVSVNLVHDANGAVEVGGPEYVALWDQFYREGAPFLFIEYEYGRQLLQGKRPRWQCRAGARFLYVDELGKVQFCSSQRGRLNKPVTEYTRADISEQSRTYKGCESGCSLFCVYRDSQVDNAPLTMARSLYQGLRRRMRLAAALALFWSLLVPAAAALAQLARELEFPGLMLLLMPA
jgi:molybdenum cofactor biosynthesis enzyme MoaA